KAWPPYTETQAATASDTSLDKTKFSTAKRADAQPQVSYNGRPLYLYQDDAAPGDMKGASKKEFGGEWYLVSPEGKKITAKGMMGKADTAMHKMGHMMDSTAHKTDTSPNPYKTKKP